MIGYSALAGGDKVTYPENFDKGTLYAVVDRHDIKQYRELYATPAAVEAVRKGQPIPSGTVLTLVQYKAQVDAAGNPTKDANGRFQKGDLVAYAVMEKRDGWGTEYKDDVRNGEWEYQADSGYAGLLRHQGHLLHPRLGGRAPAGPGARDPCQGP